MKSIGQRLADQAAMLRERRKYPEYFRLQDRVRTQALKAERERKAREHAQYDEQFEQGTCAGRM